MIEYFERLSQNSPDLFAAISAAAVVVGGIAAAALIPRLLPVGST